MGLVLEIVYESKSNITLGWNPPIGAEWYLFYAGGNRVSNAPAVDKNGVVKKQITFSKTPSPWEVVAITRINGAMGVEVGYYPPQMPPSDEEYSDEPYGAGVYSH
jgi:hypothetical protein